MNDKRSLKSAILSLLPDTLGKDIKDSLDTTLQGYFEDMKLVSRQEFDVQQKVLSKTRAKLEQLEKALEALEDKESG